MKLILAVVANEDSSRVQNALTKAHFPATRMASTGGFLMSGNTTFLSGVADEEVDTVIRIFADQCKKRKKIVPAPTFDVGMLPSSYPIEVQVGGATIFVLDVHRMEKG
jgi:uncharacterized protein YaaQ